MGKVPRLNFIQIFSVILFTGALSISGFSSQQNEIIDDSIQDFTFELVQLSYATSHVNACSGNGEEDASGSCTCNVGWNGLQCEISGGN